MPCVCDGAICVVTSCRDVTCHVYVMVLYVLLHLVEMSHALCDSGICNAIYCRDVICHVYVMVVI